MYMVAIIDWYSRYIVGYSLSNTLEMGFVIDTNKKHRAPEIISSDQGAQFTSEKYINLLKGNSIKISMDGKGRVLDNQRIERFFRSYKWEKLYHTRSQLKQITKDYIEYYNNIRPHESLSYETPADIYFNVRGI